MKPSATQIAKPRRMSATVKLLATVYFYDDGSTEYITQAAEAAIDEYLRAGPVKEHMRNLIKAARAYQAPAPTPPQSGLGDEGDSKEALIHDLERQIDLNTTLVNEYEKMRGDLGKVEEALTKADAFGQGESFYTAHPEIQEALAIVKKLRGDVTWSIGTRCPYIF
jgi:hypothetical protein